MIWAVSPFHNELDVLEIRLATLDPVVDRFVIGEAPVTQRGQPKRLFFEENRERFAPWMDKIEHVIVEDMPVGEGRDFDWDREHHQRDALMRGVDLGPGDLILSSDVDEIPFPDQLCRENCLQMRMILHQYVYALNWQWRGLPAARAMMLTPDDLRVQSLSEWGDWQEVLIGGGRGWHFSYMGGVEMIRTKLDSIADDFFRFEGYEFLKDDAWIQKCIDTGCDIYGRANAARWVPLSELPPHVEANAERFAHLLVEEPCAVL